MKITFEVGDVVTIKSGGPKMTVTDVREVNIKVIWINFHTGAIMTADFPPATLKEDNSKGH